MQHRRHFLGLLAGAALSASPRAQPATTPSPADFVASFGSRLAAVANGAAPAAERRRFIGLIIDEAVDVEGVARFCLGRFWRLATEAQQGEFVQAFRDRLVDAVAARLASLKGLRFALAGSREENGETIVTMLVESRDAPPARFDWVVEEVAGAPRITDAITGDTSLRLSQRADYASFLSHNNDITALIDELRWHAGQ